MKQVNPVMGNCLLLTFDAHYIAIIHPYKRNESSIFITLN
jgi:hypothetical protein